MNDSPGSAPAPPTLPALLGGMLGAFATPAAVAGWSQALDGGSWVAVSGMMCTTLFIIPNAFAGAAFGSPLALAVVSPRESVGRKWTAFGGGVLGGASLSAATAFLALIWFLSQ